MLQETIELISTASTPANDEEVAWDEDSDDESSARPTTATPSNPSNTSTTTLAASVKTLKPKDDQPAEDERLKPAQPRRSNDEKSVADSDASYDLVSGATSRAPSRAPGSPQEKKKAVVEESDEEDWE